MINNNGGFHKKISPTVVSLNVNCSTPIESQMCCKSKEKEREKEYDTQSDLVRKFPTVVLACGYVSPQSQQRNWVSYYAVKTVHKVTHTKQEPNH